MGTRLRLATVLASGAAAGLLGAQALLGEETDPVGVALALLGERCLPHILDGQPFSSDGLDAATAAPGGTFWVEPRSRMAIQLERRRCGVTDAFAPFSPEDRQRFVAEARSLGLRRLPGAVVREPSDVGFFDVLTLVTAGDPAVATVVLTLSHAAEVNDPWAGATHATVMRAGERGR